uniref:Uncharacterized protein n=1 Tax=Solanum lycopersicum TaxID=4081 RepID=A0A3Q7GW41_SOLLC
MRYLHVEEALDLSSNIKKYESPLIDTVSSRDVLTKFMATMTQGIFSKIYILLYFHPIDVAYFLCLNGSTSLEQRSPDIVNKSRMMNSSMTHPCDPALVPSQKRYLLVEEAPGPSSSIMKYGTPLLLMCFHPIDVAYLLGLNSSASLEQRSPDVVNKSRMMNSSMTHPCDPALVPSQKGSFDILGD